MQSYVEDLGDDPTILIRTKWLDAYKLLAGSFRLGIQPFVEPDTGQVRLSGYELLRAGLLTDHLNVTVTLSEAERQAGHLSASPTTEEARNAVMSIYIANLAPVVIETEDAKLAELYSELTKVWVVV